MIFAGEKSLLWSCDTMNTQVILRIKHKDTLTMKVLFPSQVVGMYEGNTFLLLPLACCGTLVEKMVLDFSLQLIFHLSWTLKCHQVSTGAVKRPNLHINKRKSSILIKSFFFLPSFSSILPPLLSLFILSLHFCFNFDLISNDLTSNRKRRANQ